MIHALDRKTELIKLQYPFALETNYDYTKNPAIYIRLHIFYPVSKGVQINCIFPDKVRIYSVMLQ